MQQYNKDAYSTKNIFTKEYSTNGIMIKCHMMPKYGIGCYILDFIIKKVPDYITYTVCEERQYYELYIPASYVKAYKWNLENMMVGSEITKIIQKIILLSRKGGYKLQFYSTAHNKLQSKHFLNKLKNL